MCIRDRPGTQLELQLLPHQCLPVPPPTPQRPPRLGQTPLPGPPPPRDSTPTPRWLRRHGGPGHDPATVEKGDEPEGRGVLRRRRTPVGVSRDKYRRHTPKGVTWKVRSVRAGMPLPDRALPGMAMPSPHGWVNGVSGRGMPAWTSPPNHAIKKVSKAPQVFVSLTVGPFFALEISPQRTQV